MTLYPPQVIVYHYLVTRVICSGCHDCIRGVGFQNSQEVDLWKDNLLMLKKFHRSCKQRLSNEYSKFYTTKMDKKQPRANPDVRP